MWEQIINFIQNNYLELATSSIGVGVIGKVFFDLIKGSKELVKVDFALNKAVKVSENSLETVGKVANLLIEKIEKFDEQFKNITDLYKNSQSENALLANIVIQVLSVANIPLEQKQATFNALKSLSIINDEVKKNIDIILNSQILENSNTQKELDNIYKDLEV